MKKRNQSGKRFISFIGKTLYATFNIFVAIGKTLTIDLTKNIHLYFIMAIDKQEREKIRRKLDVEKNQELIDDRLKRIERLVYAVYNDATYAKRNEGKYDLKELKKETEK
jgi:hypothetical protein